MDLKKTLQRAGLVGATLMSTGLGAMAGQNADGRVVSEEIKQNEAKLDQHFLKDTIKLEAERIKEKKEFNKVMGRSEDKDINSTNTTNVTQNAPSQGSKRAERAANRLMEKIENEGINSVKKDLTKSEQKYAKGLKEVVGTLENADSVINSAPTLVESVALSDELANKSLDRENATAALTLERDRAKTKAQFQKIMQGGR